MEQMSISASRAPTKSTSLLDILCMFVATACCAYIAIMMFTGMAREGLLGVDYYTFVRNVNQPLVTSYAPHATAPFSYPPTMPLLFWPLSQMGYLGFTTFSVAAFLLICRQHLSPTASCLAVVAFPMLNVIACGQITSLVTAIALFGLASKDRRVAGWAFAIAAGLKPQLVALFPLYLIATRDWPAFFHAALGYVAIVLASSLVYGPEVWLHWINSLEQYRHVIVTGDVHQWVVTPIGMAERHGLPLVPVLGISIICAIALPFLPYRNPVEALFGLTLGALCILPYGLAYDTLGEVPLLALLISRGKWLAVIPYSMIYPPATILSCLVIAWRQRQTHR
jgi:hypothetical protein